MARNSGTIDVSNILYWRRTPMDERVSISGARDQLVDDFNKVIGDAESLLRAMGSVPGEKASELRASVQQRLETTRQRVRNLQDKTTAAVRATDDYARENPWMLMGIAAGVGILIGLALAPSRRID